MNKIIIVVCLLIFPLGTVLAQNSINAYQYVLIPKQYDFQKEPDKYQINSLTKFLFERAGFTTLFVDDQFPEDLAKNRCSALTAIINNYSGMLNTKVNIELVDCYNRTIFITNEAKSKVKDYQKAYQEAIRNAFEEIEALDYIYASDVVIENNNVSLMEDDIINTVQEKEPHVVDEKKLPEQKIELPKKEVLIENEEVESAKEVIISKEVDNDIIMKSTVNSMEQEAKSIVGDYSFENWGKSSISKKGEDYVVVRGDENFEFATIYKTSKPTIYIIKWAAFKQPHLLEIDVDGNLIIDSDNGLKVYKRVD